MCNVNMANCAPVGKSNSKGQLQYVNKCVAYPKPKKKSIVQPIMGATYYLGSAD